MRKGQDDLSSEQSNSVGFHMIFIDFCDCGGKQSHAAIIKFW